MAAPPPPGSDPARSVLETLFAPLEGASGILAAVSGGPDSMALMHLLARWSGAGRRAPILVATVDHGLRPEAAEEAALVAREAAEQFLNVSADHPDAAKAPDALLKLGMALNGLGARDRACAVFAELDRKYPQAPAQVRQGSEREQKRNKCT